MSTRRPCSAPPAGFPVVVFFYGGTWTSGERGDYKFMGEALAERGILTVVADYRLYPEVRYPEFLKDSALAVAWSLDNAARSAAIRERVFVMGHSAGGYNAAMVALDPRWLAPTGHSAERARGVDRPGRRLRVHAARAGLAGAAGVLPSRLSAELAADRRRDAQSLRAFLAAPVDDKVVSPQRSTLAMAAKLKAAGVPVELKNVRRHLARPARGRVRAAAARPRAGARRRRGLRRADAAAALSPLVSAASARSRRRPRDPADAPRAWRPGRRTRATPAP